MPNMMPSRVVLGWAVRGSSQSRARRDLEAGGRIFHHETGLRRHAWAPWRRTPDPSAMPNAWSCQYAMRSLYPAVYLWFLLASSRGWHWQLAFCRARMLQRAGSVRLPTGGGL